MDSPSTWQRLKSMWRIMRGRDELVPEYYVHPGEPPPPHREGPPRHGALVPVGPPKRPRPSSAEALPLPEPEVREIDAVGRELDVDEAV